MKKLKISVIILIFVLGVWSVFIEPNMLTVTTVNIANKDLRGLKVVVAGDFHVKPNQQKNLNRVIETINKQHPDLILSTGDFVSGHKPKDTMPIEKIAFGLSSLKPKYGFYAVLGNHDWWQGGPKIAKVLKKDGIVVLGNENRSINFKGRKIYIAGVEDISTRKIDLVKSLKNTSAPVIAITHSPDVFPIISNPKNFQITNDVELLLAGHTHGGQVVLPFLGPLILPSSYGQRYAQGLVKENGKLMFVTRGIGTSILAVRFNCTPEIVVINFV